MIPPITAKITGRDECLHTITADIYREEDAHLPIGLVDLVINDRGMPTTAGMPSPDTWASDEVLRWASDLEDEDGEPIELRYVADAICAAVEEAMHQSEPAAVQSEEPTMERLVFRTGTERAMWIAVYSGIATDPFMSVHVDAGETADLAVEDMRKREPCDEHSTRPSTISASEAAEILGWRRGR